MLDIFEPKYFCGGGIHVKNGAMFIGLSNLITLLAILLRGMAMQTVSYTHMEFLLLIIQMATVVVFIVGLHKHIRYLLLPFVYLSFFGLFRSAALLGFMVYDAFWPTTYSVRVGFDLQKDISFLNEQEMNTAVMASLLGGILIRLLCLSVICRCYDYVREVTKMRMSNKIPLHVL